MRYVALDLIPSVIRPGDLPYFGVLRGGTFYHSGGPSFMPLTEGKYTILKDYGEHDSLSDRLSAAFHEDFSPEPAGSLQDVISSGASWLAPGGEQYACSPRDHDRTADRITRKLRIAGEGNPSDLLVKLGWFRIQRDLIIRDKPATQKQLDALFDLVREGGEAWAGLEKEFRSCCHSEEEGQFPLSFLSTFPEGEETAERKGEGEERRKTGQEPFFDLGAQPFLDVIVRFYRAHGENGRSISSFGVAMCNTEVSEGDNLIGTVEGRMEAFELTDNRRPYRYHWRAPHRGVWEAFQKALDSDPEQRMGKVSALRY